MKDCWLETAAALVWRSRIMTVVKPLEFGNCCVVSGRCFFTLPIDSGKASASWRPRNMHVHGLIARKNVKRRLQFSQLCLRVFSKVFTPFRKGVSEKLKKNWAPKKVFSKRSCLGPKKVAVRAEASCPMEHILYRMTGRLRSGTGLSEARC